MPSKALSYPASTHDRAWLDVDLGAVRHNAAQLRARAGVPLLCMVKANSYGVGAIAVCQAIGVPFAGDSAARPEAPWGVGIATLDEAQSLRDAGCIGRIVCTTPLLARELPRARGLNVRPTLHRAPDIAHWGELGGGPWHLAIDTGMSRAGICWDLVASLRDAIRANAPEGVLTHFHSADESVESRDEQDQRFAEALGALRDVLPASVIEHRDNSAGIASRTGGSPGQLARPGIALYAGMFTQELGLRQVAHLRARIVDLRDVRDRETVSYGATWTASGTRRIATVAIGYADGYRRHMSNTGRVLVRGIRCPVVGRVTMDMTMVDVTGTGAELGDVATLIGRDGGEELTMDMVAAQGGVSPYELLVGLALRVPAVHHEAMP